MNLLLPFFFGLIFLAGTSICLIARRTKTSETSGTQRDESSCEADLTGANLFRTNLSGVDLRFVKGLTQEQIDQAIVDKFTRFPKYLRNRSIDTGN